MVRGWDGRVILIRVWRGFRELAAGTLDVARLNLCLPFQNAGEISRHRVLIVRARSWRFWVRLCVTLVILVCTSGIFVFRPPASTEVVRSAKPCIRGRTYRSELVCESAATTTSVSLVLMDADVAAAAAAAATPLHVRARPDCSIHVYMCVLWCKLSISSLHSFGSCQASREVMRAPTIRVMGAMGVFGTRGGCGQCGTGEAVSKLGHTRLSSGSVRTSLDWKRYVRRI